MTEFTELFRRGGETVLDEWIGAVFVLASAVMAIGVWLVSTALA